MKVYFLFQITVQHVHILGRWQKFKKNETKQLKMKQEFRIWLYSVISVQEALPLAPLMLKVYLLAIFEGIFDALHLSKNGRYINVLWKCKSLVTKEYVLMMSWLMAHRLYQYILIISNNFRHNYLPYRISLPLQPALNMMPKARLCYTWWDMCMDVCACTGERKSQG